MIEDRDVPPNEVYLRTRADVGTQTYNNIYAQAESIVQNFSRIQNFWSKIENTNKALTVALISTTTVILILLLKNE